MAVRVNYTYKGLEVNNAYIRIGSILICKRIDEDGNVLQCADFSFTAYTKDKKHELDTFSFVKSFNPDEVINIHAFGYTKLKELDTFKNATDEK